MTPKEFRKLDTKKKAHHLSILYFKGDCFCNGRPSKEYFKLRQTFLKADEGDLTEMYMYLLDTESRPPLSDLWRCCRQYNQNKSQNHQVRDYKKVSIDELL